MKSDYLEFDRGNYEWSVRTFTMMRKLLSVNLKLHQQQEQVRNGDIFLFNHFARFETFIPQYLIYRESGAFCRSVAAAEFLEGEGRLAHYLKSVGVVPNNLPELFPLLTREILHGFKVILFPEGGMVKDRRVLDRGGEYNIYSRTAKNRRKHHAGAAVLALGVESCKQAVRLADIRGDREGLAAWQESLDFKSLDKLRAAVAKPTSIVPANITFYPIRVSDNLLQQGMELMNRGLSRRLSEELLIEGNILLKDTDMDIRLGEPLYPGHCWNWWERKLLERSLADCRDPAELFRRENAPRIWSERILARRHQGHVLEIRDLYMERMYSEVSVNLSHLASLLIMALVERGEFSIEVPVFRRMLYLAVKYVQEKEGLKRHRSIRQPDCYGGLVDRRGCGGLEQLLKSCRDSGLLAESEGCYRFLPKLCDEHEFDNIRLENLVAVYANEVAPRRGVVEWVQMAYEEGPQLLQHALSHYRFDDELRTFSLDGERFRGARYEEINGAETATQSGEPFLLLHESEDGERPDLARTGILLVHGFLASPAEMRGLGERLHAAGFCVLGIRLKGHGTSPWDLRERSWEDWLDSVRRGYEILSGFVPRIGVVGFSTGGALALALAAEQPLGLAGLAAVSVPLKFVNHNMAFIPLIHRANRLVSWLSSVEGVMPFRRHEAEFPDINYRHMPVRGLFELTRMVEALEECLPKVCCPLLTMQASEDPVVVPGSAEDIAARVASQDKQVEIIPWQRHGLIQGDVGRTWVLIEAFFCKLANKPSEYGNDVA